MIKLAVLLSILVLYLIAGYYWAYTFAKGAPYYPSTREDIQNILSSIDISTSTKIVELGSGDGRIVLALAKMGAQVTGIELNPLLSLLSRAKIFFGGYKNASILNKNIFSQDLSEYNIVIAYLFPNLMDKLSGKLFTELKSDSLIICNTFQFQDKKPFKTVGKRIRIYKVP